MSFILTLFIAVNAALVALLPIFGPILSKRNDWLGLAARRWRCIFIVCVFAVIAGSMSEYLSTRRELFRLSPADIQMRLYSEARTAKGIDIQGQPTEFGVYGTLGDIAIITEFEQIDEKVINIINRWSIRYDRRIHGLAGIDKYRFDYFAVRTTVSGLEKYPFLNDLDGSKFECLLPIQLIQSFGKTWEHQIDLYIMGRHFKGLADPVGMVSIQIDL